VKLRDLTCAGLRGVPDGNYSFADARTGVPLAVVLITGGPGSGKTTLLEAVAAAKEAIGSYGAPPDPKRLCRPGAGAARLTATWILTDAERDHARLERADQTVTWEMGTGTLRSDAEMGLRRLFAEHVRAPGRGKLEYFPANRALPPGVRSPFGPPSAEAETRLRATRAPEKYAGLVEGLRTAALAEAARAAEAVRESGLVLRGATLGAVAAFGEALAAMLPDLRLDSVELAGGGALRFLRRTREVVGLDELSESERQGVLFALAFPHFGLAGSLVLIDEPELHVHAAHRARFLHALVGLGRDNQIIAATGAAELVVAASPGQVIDLSRPAPTLRASA
jgi:energy-coupling factor transporter ATP-binding protein EcfA2